MVTTAVSPVFVDTNVLVYARDTGSPWHTDAVTTLDRLTNGGVELWASRQVLREYLATMSRQGGRAAVPSAASLIADVQGFLTRFRIAEDGPAVTAHLLTLLSRVSCGGKQVHDANIVATMLAHAVPNLLTNNPGDFARFASYITVVPLVPPAPPVTPPPTGVP
jgi:predicted nucleic acid-binding protein